MHGVYICVVFGDLFVIMCESFHSMSVV